MKRAILSALLATYALASMAQDIQLPSVDLKQTSTTVVEALATRHSVREYSDKALTNQELSNLCWAACGVSRDAQHRTSPTAMNKKEIRLFVFKAEGTYEYLAAENKLKMIVKGDNRKLLAGGGKGFSQDFVLQAPVSLLMVIDFDLFGIRNDHALLMGCVDAGNVSENINLYCQSVGLCTVPRATMDVDGIRTLFGFTDQQLPVMNNPVGYQK